jgi:hypothetical protein
VAAARVRRELRTQKGKILHSIETDAFQRV